MNDRIKPPLILPLRPPPRDDIDRLLRGFFRAEMPDPWPTLAPPREQPARPSAARPPRWLGLRRHLAVAASVALVLAGYFTLARAFPGTEPARSVNTNLNNQTLGKVPSVPRSQTVPMRNGGRARMWEQHLPKGRFRMFLELESPPARR